MQDGQIIEVGDGQMQKFGADMFAEMAKGGGFLPRVQLFGAKTTAVSEGKITMNHWGLVTGKDTIIDLGLETDVLVCSWRPTAVRIKDDAVMNYYNPNTEEFKKVQQESTVQDSGCFFGPQFLIYLPMQKRFATLLFGSQSARAEANGAYAQLGKMCTLKSRLASNKKFKWQVPVATPCSTAPASVPDPQKLQEEINAFQNPKETEVETAEPVNSGENRER